MSLKIFNTKTRSQETFLPNNPELITLYSCGPTVYSSAHIGNMRSNLLADILKRTLMFSGYTVKHVMNITDVGHLIHDTELDKMEEAAKRDNKTAKEIAEAYTQEFMEDLSALNIIPADHFPRASEFIAEQIALIQQLEQKGFTYRIADGIYFDTSLFKTYGSFSGQILTEKNDGARVEINPEKKNPYDFALWKFSPTHEKRQMEWESPWGIGFPGWHIECSAMSMALLGQPIDIHTGGIDLIPVHHENEIAQSEAASGKEFVRYWMHGEFVDIAGEKMAKSEGNFITLTTLQQKGYHPLAYRYLTLNTHYRSKLNFTYEALLAAQNALFNIRDEVREWQKATIADESAIEQFTAAIHDDLNMPRALAVMWELIKSDKLSETKSATLARMDEVLGLNLTQWIARPLKIPQHIILLAEQRLKARKEKQWEQADHAREQIEAEGFCVKDTPEGYRIHER